MSPVYVVCFTHGVEEWGMFYQRFVKWSSRVTSLIHTCSFAFSGFFILFSFVLQAVSSRRMAMKEDALSPAHSVASSWSFVDD